MSKDRSGLQEVLDVLKQLAREYLVKLIGLEILAPQGHYGLIYL